MKLKLITNDLFDIANRLKVLDVNYFVVYNKLKRKYEVHHKKQKEDSFAFSVENKLDARAIKKAIVTSIKHANKILSQIEKQNSLLQKKEVDLLLDQNMIRFKNYIDYANAKSCDINFDLINENKWI